MKKSIILYMAIIALLSLFSTAGCSNKTNVGSADLDDMSWDEITKAAEGTAVNFYMWGGDTRINNWIDSYAAENVERNYGIKINRVPMNAEDFMNKLASEKQAGKEKGSIDLLWINGENFYAAKENGMLYGPFATKLPNFNKYVNPNTPDNTLDFGYPTEGYEVPYGRAQLVLVYDSGKVKNPPKNLNELVEFVKQNPGKFTYPAPPDFTGSAFVRNIMYMTTGGYQQYMSIDDKEIKGSLQPAWDFLNSVKPYLWREGNTYPSTIGQLDSMFADGEVLMTMTYMPLKPSGDVIEGVFPKDTKTFVLEEGTISNTHFLAVPQNAGNKAGALVVANFLESFDAQLSKLEPQNWGDLPVFDPTSLSKDEKAKLSELDLGSAAMDQQELAEHRAPEIPSKHVPEIEELWMKNIAGEKK
ncbi:MAG TPA: ABC transporter substrate-binding protein [Clostridia bacterium]|nr:ABC transporter substrate-binding protein [Clostridia bacterium]